MKFAFFLFLLFAMQIGIAQDEVMLRGDTVVVNHELKIRRISKDTLQYRAFGKTRYFLMEKVMAYRYKDSAWTYVDKSDKQKYIIRQGSLLLRYLQPDIILSRYELKNSQIDRIKYLSDYEAHIPVKGKKAILRKNRPVIVRLYPDTTKTPILMPLKKISSDSLFFVAELYNKKKPYGIPIKDIEHILFDTDVQRAVGTNMGALGGLIALTNTGGQVYSKVKFTYSLKPDDWELLPNK